MASLAWHGGQSFLPSHHNIHDPSVRRRSTRRASGGGPKGPPSAPPTIPPIIITPFVYQVPEPAIDPRIKPPKPPVVQRRPCISC